MYVSPSHKRLLGCGTEVLGRSIFEHIHPEDLEYVKRTFTQFDPNLVEKFIWILEEAKQENSFKISFNCMKA